MVQLIAGRGELFVHTGQTVAQQQHTGGQRGGVVRHAGFLLLLLRAQAALGVFGVQAGFGQDLPGFDAGLFRHRGGRGRGGRGGRFRRGLHRLAGRHAALGDHRFHLVDLLLQVMAAELPFVTGALAVLEFGLQRRDRIFGLGELGGRIAARLFGGFGAGGGLVELVLQLFHADTRVGLLFFQLFHLGVELVDGLLQFHFPLLGLVGQRVHVCQHIVFIEPEHAGSEPLILDGWFL